MPQDTPSRRLDQYIVRFPAGMRDRLKEAAAINNRSLNAEIVIRLEQSLEIDLKNPAVQEAMIANLDVITKAVMEQMREETKINRAMPLLLEWFDQNPDERRAYEAMPPDEQDEFVQEQAHALWLEHLNQVRAEKRKTVPARKPAKKAPKK